MAEAPKRPHDPPTGETPGKKPQKRRSGSSGRFIKKTLFQLDSELEKDMEQKVSMYTYIKYLFIYL